VPLRKFISRIFGPPKWVREREEEIQFANAIIESGTFDKVTASGGLKFQNWWGLELHTPTGPLLLHADTPAFDIVFEWLKKTHSIDMEAIEGEANTQAIKLPRGDWEIAVWPVKTATSNTRPD